MEAKEVGRNRIAEIFIKNQNVKYFYLTFLFVYSILYQVIHMEKIAWQGLLYDFYGELLTEHQKQIYEDAVYNDFSLGEIAQEYGISRQGVHDLIKRCDNSLQEYENKLHLVEKFLKIKDRIGHLQQIAEDENVSREALIRDMKEITHQILEEL